MLKLPVAIGALIAIGCKIVIETCLGVNEDKEYITPSGEAKRQMDNIFKALINKDPEPIKEIFCEKASERLDLDSELKQFVDFIDGNIISYDKSPAGASGGAHDAEKGWIERTLSGYIDNIKTDTGKTYYIYFESNFIKENHPEAIGVVFLRINDKDMYNPKTLETYPDGGHYEIDVYP